MKRLNRILVVLNPLQEEQPALDRAMSLARGAGAALELYCVDFNEALTGDYHIDTTVLRELRDAHTKEVLNWLAGVREEVATSGIEVSGEAEYGRPEHEHVLHRVREVRPDLVIKTTRLQPAIKRTYFTASDWHLIKNCSVPLLFVKQKEFARGAPIIAAIDPFHREDRPARLDQQILETGEFLAKVLETSLHVVHVVAPLSRFPVTGEAYQEQLATESSRLDQRLETVRALSGPFAVPDERIHVLSGRPKQVIPIIAAERDARIIVMGAISRSNLKELFVGNTAEQVLEEVESDLLVLHLEGLDVH